MSINTCNYSQQQNNAFGKRMFLFTSFFLALFTIYSASAANTLNIAGWDVYADPENKDKTIGFESFEKKHGVEIKFLPLQNLDKIVEAAESGTDYDLFIISNEGIQQLHDMSLVEPLELDKLSHYKDLHQGLRFSEWSLFESRVYAAPWAWGPTGLLYDTEVVKNPDSWNILWDEKYRGQVSLWDDVSIIWTAALALGYKNVYSLTRGQLKKVKKKLLELNKQVHAYYSGEEEEINFVLKDKVVLLNSWFDPSARYAKAGRSFKMIIPKEGAVGMFDSYLINKSSQQKELAYQYINHQISPEVQQKMVRITGLSPANMKTTELLTAEEIKALHLDEPDYFNRMLLWDQMPRKKLYEKVLEEVNQDLQALKAK